MSASRIKAKLPFFAGRGETVVEIDGQDYAKALRSITVTSHVNQVTTARLELAMVGAEIDAEAHLYLTSAQVELLARFGWLPPDGAETSSLGDVRLVAPLEAVKRTT